MARDAGVEEEVDGAIEDAIDNIVLLGTNVVVVVPDILVAEVLVVVVVVVKAETATWTLLSTSKVAVKIIATTANIRDSRCCCR